MNGGAFRKEVIALIVPLDFGEFIVTSVLASSTKIVTKVLMVQEDVPASQDGIPHAMNV